MINRLNILKESRGRFANNSELAAAFISDVNFKQEVETLYKYYFSKTLKGCQNCFCDGYHELINLKQERIMEKSKCEFKLRAGALLQDRRTNQDKYRCTNVNLTNDLALYHLKTNPTCEKYFTQLPADWKEQVKAYRLEGEPQPIIVSVMPDVDDPTDNELTDLEKENNDVIVEQSEAEAVAVAKIKDLLAGGMKKSDVEKIVIGWKTIGSKPASVRFAKELIKRA